MIDTDRYRKTLENKVNELLEYCNENVPEKPPIEKDTGKLPRQSGDIIVTGLWRTQRKIIRLLEDIWEFRDSVDRARSIVTTLDFVDRDLDAPPMFIEFKRSKVAKEKQDQLIKITNGLIDLLTEAVFKREVIYPKKITDKTSIRDRDNIIYGYYVWLTLKDLRVVCIHLSELDFYHAKEEAKELVETIKVAMRKDPYNPSRALDELEKLLKPFLKNK